MTHKALEEYFHLIVNKPLKETTMFDKTKMFFTQQIEKINSLLTKPVAFKEEPVNLMTEDYWAFEMYTGEWVDEDGETRPVNHTVAIEPHNGTWMEVLDRILDEMEKHYGYNIKEQVYYSVVFPNNTLYYSPDGKPPAGYGRNLNDEVFQKLLLSFPEVYEMSPATERGSLE